MKDGPKPLQRDRDLTQPVSKLHSNEAMKAKSRHLRGTIVEGLADPLTGSVSEDDARLLKFHGMYLQDDRDLREERRRSKLEPDYQFMVRVRLPGGIATPAQWLALDSIARDHGCRSLRLTTRQTIQFHGILKSNLRAAIRRLDAALLDTIAACGDDCRGVTCSVHPQRAALHATVYALAKRASAQMRWKSGAYREIWLGETCVRGGEPEANEEPFFGDTYLPRKFKIGFAIPPVNDIDVFTHDLGFIAIAEGEELLGFDVCVGGGMGRTDRAPMTYPRLADVIGFVTPDKVLQLSETIVSIQRDYGDRVDRSRARFKYTIDDRGLPWFTEELQARLGYALEPARAFRFETNGDRLGWLRGSDGRWHLGLYIENGRISSTAALPWMDALRTLVSEHDLQLRLTANQNLILSQIAEADRGAIIELFSRYGIDVAKLPAPLRRNALSCVALPTCGLAMAESERYLPRFLEKLELLQGEHGLRDQPISVRMTGCPNGCARPYVAEIGLTGRAPGKYNLYLGGGNHGERLNVLHSENIGEVKILEILGGLFARYARERRPHEPFGDFVMRSGAWRNPNSTDN
jgi:sulfite reductase (NADPH) hemoprotein beta-component